MKRFKAGVVGATGMVGQRFVTLLKEHPWFDLTVVAASPRSAGKPYAEVVSDRWMMKDGIPEDAAALIIKDAAGDAEKIAGEVDFIFSAVDMQKEEIRVLEEKYAKLECPVISNNSAHRFTKDVPMVIPEVNHGHIEIVEAQRKRLGIKRGFIAVKSNCSIQSFVPALHPLKGFGLNKVLVCTYQAISGASKNFDTWPEMVDNVIPYIGGEEEKTEIEPLKIWGTVQNGEIISASLPQITSQCIRVPVSDGHMAAVFASFDNKPALDEILSCWNNFKSGIEDLSLPSAPERLIHYFDEPNRPQTRLDRNLENGMAITVGRLREDTQFDYKFVGLSHNTLRGAAGGAVLLAELMCARGYI